MKLLALLTLTTTALAAALALPLATRDENCDACTAQFNFCTRNGHTVGEEGCRQTCAEHVCHVNRYDGANPRECRDCGGEFDMCPEVGKSRYFS